MSALEDYLTGGHRSADSSGEAAGPAPYDEVAEAGEIRDGWKPIAQSMRQTSGAELGRIAADVGRLIEDDGATYNRIRRTTDSDGDEVTEAVIEPWQLDAVPLILTSAEFCKLRVALEQRTRLLDAVVTDLYGEQRLLADGTIPPSIIMAHGGYVRYAHGITVPGKHQLLMNATDLGRAPDGQWTALGDRTQAPSGMAYAMENRRVMSRLFPEAHQDVQIARLLPFFNAFRDGIEAAAPAQSESPKVVVLSPGAHSETAFDQSYLASLLGYPLVEGADLTMRDGRVWMRSAEPMVPVDVIIRRIDATWTDPLFLRGGSRLGVPGLVDAARRGTVSIVNGLGSGVLENPALMSFLPALSKSMLGEDLLLPNVESFWCGEDKARQHVLSNLASMVLRPIDRERAPTVYGGELSEDELSQYKRKIEAAPHLYVGQELIALSQVPTAHKDRLEARPVMLRSFTVSAGEQYAVLSGGLARVPGESTSHPLIAESVDDQDPAQTVQGNPPERIIPIAENRLGRGVFARESPPNVAKDTWVLLGEDADPGTTGWLHDGPSVAPTDPFMAMTPRMLSDLFWIGRYSARAEDLVRLILSIREITGDLHSAPRGGAGAALSTMRQALTQVSQTYPGFLDESTVVVDEINSLMMNQRRTGTLAQAVVALESALQGVRDQFSADVWIVLAAIDRALGQLRSTPADSGVQLVRSAEEVHRALLGLSGIFYDNMMHDPGWHLLEAGRSIERAATVTALLRSTICARTEPYADSLVIDSVLKASESIVTYRRRYRGRAHIDGVLNLLLVDEQNPRSVIFALRKLSNDVLVFDNDDDTRVIPDAVERALAMLRGIDVVQIARVDEDGMRTELHDFLGELYEEIQEISTLIYRRHLRGQATQQPIFEGTAQVGAGS